MSDVVLITGGGIGIGRATALAFAAQGDRVVITDVLEAEGRAVVAEIEAAGGTAEFQLLDVTDTQQADAVVADVETRLGSVDVIVANAGIAHRIPLDELSDEKWDQTFDIDLKGMLRVVRPAASRHEGAWERSSDLPVIDHGRCIRLGRTRSLLRGEIRRRRIGSRIGGRAGAQRYSRQWRCSRLHPHSAAVVGKAFSWTCRSRNRRRNHSAWPRWSAG